MNQDGLPGEGVEREDATRKAGLLREIERIRSLVLDRAHPTDVEQALSELAFYVVGLFSVSSQPAPDAGPAIDPGELATAINNARRFVGSPNHWTAADALYVVQCLAALVQPGEPT